MATVSIHPSFVLQALDAEADAWARETGLAGMVARMSGDPATRQVLMRFARQCFAEGAYRGALNAIDRKPLSASIDEARGTPDGTPR